MGNGEVMKDRAKGVHRWARYTAEMWCDPGQFASPEDFFAAIEECLDEVCRIQGKTPVEDFSAVEFKGPRRLSA